MAEISTQTALEIERARSTTVAYLQNLGYTIPNNATWDTIATTLDGMRENDIVRGFLNGGASGRFIDNTITYIKGYAFYRMSSLTEIQINNATNISASAFNGCSGLTKPLVLFCTNSADNQLSGMSSPVPVIYKNLLAGQSQYKTSVTAPILDYQGDGSTSLSNISLVGWTGSTLILRSNTVTNLGGVSNIPSSVNEIYVPHDLVETYKQATNWSTIANKIKDIKGSDYESLTWYEGWSLQTP